MVLVDDEVAGGDFRGVGDELVGAFAAFRRAGDALPEEVLLGDQGHAVHEEAALDGKHRQGDGAFGQGAGFIGAGDGADVLDAVFAQHEGEALAGAGTPCGEDDCAAGGCPFGAQFGKAVERSHGLAGEDGAGAAADVDTLGAVRLAEGGEFEAGGAGKLGVEGLAVQIQHARRDGTVGLLAGAGGAATLGVVVGDEL